MPSRADASGEQAGSRLPAGLRVSVETGDDGTATIRLAGELDLATADLVRDALHELDSARWHDVRLDLGQVSFCDCTGLGALISGDSQLRSAGGRLTLTDASAPVRRLIMITQLDRVFAID